jgi:phosphoglycolate phosphatase-like HAD superfamily hydrolase
LKKLVLFDIDGTILLSAGAGGRAIIAATAQELGMERGIGGVRFDGKTDPQIVSELLVAAGQEGPHSPETIDSICRRYVELLELELDRPSTRTTMMPGVTRLLDRLEQDSDTLIGLLTGNLAPGAALKLRSAGLDPARFRVGAFGSDAADRGALPPIAARRAEAYFGRVPCGPEVVIIGDTPADIACGQCINARAIAVATGGYSVSDLTTCGPHAVFQDLSDTDRVMDAIFG